MNTTIDTLSIDIETSSENSTKGLDTLITRLQDLDKTITSSLEGLDKLKTSLESLSKIKVNNIKMPSMKDVNVPLIKSKAMGLGEHGLLNTGADVSMMTRKPKKQDNVSGKGTKQAGKDADDAGKKADTASSRFKKLASAVKSVTGGTIKRIGGVVAGVGATAGKVGLQVAKGFGKVATAGIKKLGLALVGVRSAFTAVRSAMQEYMNYDTNLRDSLSQTWASLGSLLAPILEYVIKLFGTAVAYVRAFVKALTGVDLVARANSKAVGAMGDSAKKALGSLAKFDDLNTVDFSESSGSGSDLKPLTTPDIDTTGIDRFADLIKNGDWYNLGFELGEKINEGLSSINFDSLIEKAGQLGTNLGNVFNGLTDGINWTLLGESIAGGLNTVISFGNGFLDTYDFKNLGDSLTEGLNSAMNNTDWTGLGNMLGGGIQGLIDVGVGFALNFDYSGFGKNVGDGLNGALEKLDLGSAGKGIGGFVTGVIDSIGSFLATADWGAIASDISSCITGFVEELTNWIKDTDWAKTTETLMTSIGEFLSNVDWAGIVSGIFELLGSAIGAIGTVIATFVSKCITAIGEYFSQFIDEDAGFWENGKNILLGVLEGIVDAIANIGTWIWDNIFVPFIDGFKDAFDINSPSKEMEEQGSFIIDGLFNGLKGLWNRVKQIFIEFKDKVEYKFAEIKANISKTFSKENITKIFNTVKETITNKFTEIKNNIKTKMTEAWENVKGAFSKVGTFFQGIFDKIKSIFKSIGTKIGNAIGDSFKTVVNKIIGFAENTINKFIKAINKAIGLINEIPGVDISLLKEITIPKLATGTNEIEAEGLYHLHKGEAVVPKKYNPAVNDQAVKTDNSEVVDAIYNLKRSIDNLDITNVVNLGNKTLYKETVKYAKNQNDIYGENVMSV